MNSFTSSIIEKIKNNSRIKNRVLNMLMHPVKTRPRLWLRLLQFTYMKRGKGSVIYRSVRKDILPFNKFSLGQKSVIEDFCCVNNAVGDVIIGDETRLGLNNPIIGPVIIGIIILYKDVSLSYLLSKQFYSSFIFLQPISTTLFAKIES